MNGYALANTKRSWYIENIQIYGTVGWGEFEYLMTEDIDSTISVYFDKISLGDNSQQILFADLIDTKGNSLPSTISNPKVLIKPKSEGQVYIVGNETNSGFKIVRTKDSSATVQIDLYVIEMGD